MNQFDPGSQPARREGCTCPRVENNNGAGINEQYDEYVMDVRCPLHGHDARSDETVATADGDHVSQRETESRSSSGDYDRSIDRSTTSDSAAESEDERGDTDAPAEYDVEELAQEIDRGTSE